MIEPAKAVLARGPLADGEGAGGSKIRRLSDVSTVIGVVEPLAGVPTTVGTAMQVLDVDLLARVKRQAGGALLVLTELKFAHVVAAAVLGCRVPTSVVVPEVEAVFHLEEITFPCGTVSPPAWHLENA